MYTGTLIEQLIMAVERVESRAQEQETAELEQLYLADTCALTKYEQSLLGVA